MKVIKFKEQTTIVAEHQDEYTSLPAHQFNDTHGRIAFCWKMTWYERIHVLFTGIIWHEVLTFDTPLQPQKLGTAKLDFTNKVEE